MTLDIIIHLSQLSLYEQFTYMHPYNFHMSSLYVIMIGKLIPGIRYCMLSASSRSLSPRKQMAADENKMADSSDRPTPHQATMYDQSYHTRVFSRNIWFIPDFLANVFVFVCVRDKKTEWVYMYMFTMISFMHESF